jgi:hypothetical protein
LLRTYKLPQAQYIPYLPEYGGCKSWIDLDQQVSLQGSQPVLSDTVYGQLVETIRGIIGDRLYATSC